jgi:hypothetical protein
METARPEAATDLAVAVRELYASFRTGDVRVAPAVAASQARLRAAARQALSGEAVS